MTSGVRVVAVSGLPDRPSFVMGRVPLVLQATDEQISLLSVLIVAHLPPGLDTDFLGGFKRMFQRFHRNGTPGAVSGSWVYWGPGLRGLEWCL